MTSEVDIARSFMDALPESQRGGFEGARDIGETLVRLIGAAVAQWPGVELDGARYAAHLASKIPGDADPGLALDRLRTSDLYLACACGEQIDAAIAAFERRYLEELPAMVAHLNLGRAQIDDLTQQVSTKLLTVRPDAHPAILDYAGRGDLHSWVRVAAVRAGISALRRVRKSVPLEAIADMPEPGDDPELGHLKATYRTEFKAAFEEGLGALTERQRNLLRHQVIDRLTVTQVGVMYDVHQATAARWLVSARETLVVETKRALTRRLRIDKDELESILRLIHSQVDVSIRRLLKPGDAA